MKIVYVCEKIIRNILSLNPFLVGKKEKGYKYLELNKHFFGVRIPKKIAINGIKALQINNKCSAGKKIVVETNAGELNLYIAYQHRCVFSHMSNVATSGIDLYEKVEEKEKWIGNIHPDNNVQMQVKRHIVLSEGEKNIEFYFPPFAQIKRVVIGVPALYYIRLCEKSDKLPIIVYGSSISQGCAASRAALSYVNLVQRGAKHDVLNFGFSESARGEKEIINYIATIKAKAFIIEYDHNVSCDILRRTHLAVYTKIREYQKDCLIIFMTRFSGGISITKREENERVNIIKSTYEYALKTGDGNVSLILGYQVMPMKNKTDFFVDDRHPNDAGMQEIAKRILHELEIKGYMND